MSRRRACFQWASALLCLGGVGGAFWEWLDHGRVASAEPGFLVALTASAVGALTYSFVTMLPDVLELERDQKRCYGSGVRDGMALASGVDLHVPAEPAARHRHLTPVR